MVTRNFSDDSPAGQILHFLQRNAKATVRELGDLLGISATAVRDHLVTLQNDGLIMVRSERHGPGRPRMVYTLTEKAQSIFPRQYDSLLNSMISELLAVEGQEMVAMLLDRVSRRLAAEYSSAIKGDDVRQRLGQLRTQLVQRGVPAEIANSEENDDTSLRLFACPFYELAHNHPQVCSMERRMLEYVLGGTVSLSNKTIREGHHTCHFVIQPS